MNQMALCYNEGLVVHNSEQDFTIVDSSKIGFDEDAQ